MRALTGSVIHRNDITDPSTNKDDLNAAINALVTVRVAANPAGTGLLANVFDINAVPLANPITSDNNGNYVVYVDNGTYDLISREGLTSETIEEGVYVGTDISPDLSQEYIFNTVADYQASIITFPVGKKIKLTDRDAVFTVEAGIAGADGYGTIANTIVNQNITLADEEITFKGVGATGGADDTGAIQAAINSGKTINFNKGSFNFSTLTIPSGVVIRGAGFHNSTLNQIVGTNADAITSGGIDIVGIELVNFSVNCNYFTGAWNDSVGVIGNSSGNGIVLKAYAAIVDVICSNVAGIGLWMQEPDAPENSGAYESTNVIGFSGRDYGKEGMILQGPNDWILNRAFIGRAGILPRPLAETTISMSSVYSGDAVDGIVLDGMNVEINDLHVYANWSGTGFRTRGNCRLTKGGRIISESSRAQVNLSAGTYGAADIDIRNLALLHPDWSGTIPTYTYPNEEWDGISIHSGQQLTVDITCKRTITAFKRVVGVTGGVAYSGAKVGFIYSNSTAPTGDPEAGSRYSGIGFSTQSTVGGKVAVNGRQSNGHLAQVLSSGANVDVSAYDCTSAIIRDSVSNSLRGNKITGTVNRCGTGFTSVGTPTAEIVNLAMELSGVAIPFSGDALDTFRGQIWDISASIDNVAHTTRQFLESAELSGSTTAEQTIVVPHNFLFTPPFQMVQYSIDDRPATNDLLEYCYLTTITSTELTFAYKYSATSGPTFNQRINIRLG